MAKKRRQRQGREALILALARQMGIRDPRAVLSVAAQEGLGGGVGDSGTSFGPFQLHVGGAFPSGVKGNRQAWAWSRPGLLYALSRIKKVAGNRQGADAIRAIVSQFERPADPSSEIAKALAYYGRGGGSNARATQQPSSPQSLPGLPNMGAENQPDIPTKQEILQRTLLNRGDLLDAVRQIKHADSARAMYQTSAPSPALAAALGAPVRRPLGVPAELFYDPIGGIKFGKQIGPIGGHSTHVHAAYTDPRSVLAALAYARKLGLRVSENPYVDHVDPVHTKHSYHYRAFPGLFHGRRLGEAFDASGRPEAMRQLYLYLSRGLRR